MTTPIIRRLDDLRANLREWKRNGDLVGVVPTMGALHDGHLSLVRAAKASCDRVIVTLFVNPRQFNSPEDFAKYPRTEIADAEILAPLDVDALFVPHVAEMYPLAHATTISISGVSEPLEGAHRPGHFDGVATVVALLFNMTQADRAFFGEKDWQQLLVVQRMVTDLRLPVEIVPCPSIRTESGLALSSRNQRLSDQARARAVALPEALFEAADAIAKGKTVDNAIASARARISIAGFDDIEYLELRDSATLGPAQADRPARLLVAAWLDGVRLIDNVAVPPSS
ncbi:pantoate--beta-alanine ligase [Paracoccus aestuariivivens]|uniref:Pantothenate synthetase n=1 Tax=Paracoccus aestuariivivens TaxID=1820333 RepID=A0A6L6J902_9RHOB|nr:pantoate--beta-alanine ligase [Paracoccus aestuariivivens]MTH77986.1 pantoate--beta-alanine ligase [Paracoccus aestuariivivens]